MDAFKNEISSPRRGMSKGVDPRNLEPNDYTHALNASITNDDGDFYDLTYEKSNVMEVVMPNGYKVIGRFNRLLKNRTYYFLHNPNTKYNLFGYVDNGVVFDDTLDTTDLPQPLEDTIQSPYRQFTTLIDDSCFDNPEDGFNFDLDHPIQNPLVKEQKTGGVVYFTDVKNKPRYIELDNIETYFTQEQPCEGDVTTNCPLMYKMLLHKEYELPLITDISVSTGGSLKKGVYSFVISLSDSLGNEISEYFSQTQYADIFSQGETDATDKAIRLKVETLDKNYTHYKLVIVFSDKTDGAVTYYDGGTHSTNREEIVISDIGGLQRTSNERISYTNQRVNKSEGFTTANKSLLEYGLVFERELNLQPIANLLGSFLQWQTHIAKENLYSFGESKSKFAGINRNEVVPYGIRFLRTGGTTTPVFPLVGREAIPSDLVTVPSADINRKSIEVSETCADTIRDKRWQIFDTSTVTDTNPNIGTSTYTETTTEECRVMEGVSSGPDGFPFPDAEEGVSDIAQYIKYHLPNCSGYLPATDLCAFYNGNYDDIVCSISEGENCTYESENTELEVNRVINPRIERAIDPDAMYPPQTPNCTYQPDSYIRLEEGVPTAEPLADQPSARLLQRTPNINNNSLNREALTINNMISENSLGAASNECGNYTSSPYLIYNCEDEDDYLTEYVSNGNLMGGIFKNKVNIRAQWFGFDYRYITTQPSGDPVDGIVVNITKTVNSPTTYGGDALPMSPETYPINQNYRVSFFDGNDYGAESFFSFIHNSNESRVILIYQIGNNVYIRHGAGGDTVIADTTFTSIHMSVEQAHTTFIAEEPDDRCIINPTKGVYNVITFPMKLGDRWALWDDVTFNVVNTFSKTCEYEIPDVGNCDAVPYQKGEFGYNEQQSIYPDNPELYDSSKVVVDLSKFPSELQGDIQSKVLGNPTQGGYQVRNSFNLTCQPIRHFRFPSNKTSPFMAEEDLGGGQESFIYPLGVTIDERVINSFLDVAVDNELISKEERDTIYGYEIFRGDLTVTRSVVASGLLYDLRSYIEKNKTIHYSNYPYNSKGPDVLNNLGTPTADKNYGSAFTFQSPETDYYFRDNSANEISIEGYQFGSSFGQFDEVEGHPKWTLLTRKAEQTASKLATWESILNVAVGTAEIMTNRTPMWYTVQGGIGSTGGGSNAVDAGIQLAAALVGTAALVASTVVFEYARYKQQWLDTIENLGVSSNFAYYYFSRGDYNNFKALYSEPNTIRGLQTNKPIKDGRNILTNKIDRSETIELNHVDREWTTFLNIGSDFKIVYPPQYMLREMSSLYYSSLAGISGKDAEGRSPEIVRDITSPYIHLKRFSADQHGGINSVSWITTSYKGDLREPKESWLPIFGGDTVITRHTLKRKFPVFLTTAMGQSSTTAFKYSFYNNIGRNPKFFIDFKTDNTYSKKSLNMFPVIRSRYNTDNQNDGKFYLTEPSKIYLYYYGIPNFLTETRINTNYRESGREPRQQFYPDVGDIGNWTQENNVRLREPNYFKYSNTYSKSILPFNSRTLPTSYTKERQDIIENSVNGVIFSLPDYDENGQTDPWLKFLPLDYYEFDTRYGKLKELKGIENEAVLARFEHTAILYNKVDSKIDTGQSPSTYIGGRHIFQRRTASFVNSELGYGGTTHKESLSTEYGHFYVDNNRGQIMQIPPGGGSMSEISYVNAKGEMTNMKEWFKRHLPFKIKSSGIENIEDFNIDNSYNSVGMTFGWDSMNKRVLITKKDYIPKVQGVQYSKGQGFYYQGREVEITDEQYFEDVSWTVGYYPSLGKYSSFYSYAPNYYNNHFNYFSAGRNDLETVWTHNVTNKSAGVFFGTKYPMEVEVLTKSTMSSYIGSVGLLTEAKRYYNNEDYLVNQELTFNKSIIYNRRECSGNLVLDLVKGHTRYLSRYPIGVDNKTQRIPMTRTENMFNYNYFYNRVDKTQQLPILNNDKNEMLIEVNNVNFNQRGQLERLNGDYYLNRLTYDTDSRYLLTIKLNKSLTNLDRM